MILSQEKPRDRGILKVNVSDADDDFAPKKGLKVSLDWMSLDN